LAIQKAKSEFEIRYFSYISSFQYLMNCLYHNSTHRNNIKKT
jgi:hypothetical protein